MKDIYIRLSTLKENIYVGFVCYAFHLLLFQILAPLRFLHNTKKFVFFFSFDTQIQNKLNRNLITCIYKVEGCTSTFGQ